MAWWLAIAALSTERLVAQESRFQNAVRQGGASVASRRASPQDRYADQRIAIPLRPSSEPSEMHPASAPPTPQTASLVRRAAHGEILSVDDRPTIAADSIIQSDGYGCDCGQCLGEPTCGWEAGCGVEAGCDAAACGDDFLSLCLPILRINWCNYEFFGGVSGFTGPANFAGVSVNDPDLRSGTGSFGFFEGLNSGRSLRPLGLDLALQAGVRAAQSNLSAAAFTDESRNQVFVTGGLFRRVDFGLQYGLVVDYLYDDWWFRNDLVQLRGELSWNDSCGHEFGYQFMAGVNDSSGQTSVFDIAGAELNRIVGFEAVDQHRFFFRGQTAGGGEYQAFAGGTGSSDGLIGLTMTSAMRNRLALQGGAAYLIPSEGRRSGGFENESWNLSMGIVFRPGGGSFGRGYSRPLFDVADNGTFMVDRQ